MSISTYSCPHKTEFCDSSTHAETRLAPASLPGLAQDPKMLDERVVSLEGCDLTYVYYTTNSSCSDITSPITPTFSARSHLRCSSSASSLELPPQPLEGPGSPCPVSTKASLRHLPDVQEEPLERDDDQDSLSDYFDLYSCLCDRACKHHESPDVVFNGDLVNELGIDYDLGFSSDNDAASDARKKKRATGDTFVSITSRFNVRMPSISRWRGTRQATHVMSSPTNARSRESFSKGPGECVSSRSSSVSSPGRRFPVILSDSSVSPSKSVESLHARGAAVETVQDERARTECDRSMATTPLLPPMMTGSLRNLPQKSPLQSPSIASTSPASPQLQRSSISTEPSRNSLQQMPALAELPFSLPPSIVQEQDAWSDRLGHANFTIMPVPYELDSMTTEAVMKYRDDWDAARVNYTKHLVRTGENYGHTSKIYALTEAKWAETEQKWRATYDIALRELDSIAPTSMMMSRSRSRGRGRGRAEATLYAGARGHFSSNDDALAAVHWRRMEDCVPAAVPQLLEALDADGKFPSRGDEGIVGPMQRDAYMLRR
ncbi:hypothetical protein ESCO_001421 [Escovopsis weberi]|uniref:Only prolin and serin are matching in the corresponding protein n=1 Tax=Escovopsis weberi TaxID=150374 RepID=A0A0M8N2L9_ESCWE|nr:hypothetical protein ESCO_001421 [Escovopsis weberi]